MFFYSFTFLLHLQIGLLLAFHNKINVNKRN